MRWIKIVASHLKNLSKNERHIDIEKSRIWLLKLLPITLNNQVNASVFAAWLFLNAIPRSLLRGCAAAVSLKIAEFRFSRVFESSLFPATMCLYSTN
jgi:hypothetical protein